MAIATQQPHMTGRLRTLAITTVIILAATGVAITPALAAPVDGERSAPASVAPGDTATVTVNVTMDSEGGSLTVNETFSGPIESASIQSVQVDGSDANPVVEVADPDGAVVTLSSTGPNATVTVKYQITASTSTGSITITGVPEGSGESIDLGTTTIEVQQDPLTASSSLNDQTLKPGQSATVTTSVDNPGSELTVNHTFSKAVGSASVGSVTVNGNSASPTVSTADANGSIVTLENLSSTDTISIDITVGMADDATIGDQIAITGQASSGNDTVSLDAGSIEVVDPDPVKRYDRNGDGSIEISDLGSAATDYALGDLSITELAKIAAAFAN